VFRVFRGLNGRGMNLRLDKVRDQVHDSRQKRRTLAQHLHGLQGLKWDRWNPPLPPALEF